MKKTLMKTLSSVMIAAVVISTGIILPKRDVQAATTNELIKKVCDIAKKEEGYKGYDNKGNKYGKYINDFHSNLYWGSKEHENWCDVFVDWCMIRAFGYVDACKITNQGTGNTGSRENKGGAQTYYTYKPDDKHNSEYYYKQMGRLLYPQNNSPQKGDQVFFTWEHTGLIVGTERERNGQVKYLVAEGNCSNKVQVKTRYISEIRSFGRPNYAAIAYNPTCGEDEFVTRLYKECLGRDPDADGRRYWINRLQNKQVTAATVVWEFFNSDEFKRNNFNKYVVVYRLYRAVLNRDYDQDGYNYWTNNYNSISYRNLVNGFLYNDEFRNECRRMNLRSGV